MAVHGEELRKLLDNPAFPRSSTYDPDQLVADQMGPSALWLTEWLCAALELEPGMRVLDMGCGRCLSSIYLVREHGVRVWANDLWIPATENWSRIVAAGLADSICPIHAEAHALPYAEGFFDAIVSLDSYHYYGTSDNFLRTFIKYLKPGGQLGIVVPALTRELGATVPEYLTRKQKSGGVFWDPTECFTFHTASWWQQHWQKTGLVDVELADTMPDGWQHWLQWERALEAADKLMFPSDEEALAADKGRTIGFVRAVARRKS